jgi:hypothetical protein
MYSTTFSRFRPRSLTWFGSAAPGWAIYSYCPPVGGLLSALPPKATQ